MGRAHLLVLALSAVTAGCAAQELPIEVRIDARFSERETGRILSAMAEANAALGQGSLGHAVLLYDGRHEDADGFDLDDLEDGIHVIYREKRAPAGLMPHGREGFGTLSDVVLYMDAVAEHRGRRTRRTVFRHTVLHEIGHLLGMLHSGDPADVMSPDSDAVHYSENDRRQFCSIYGC